MTTWYPDTCDCIIEISDEQATLGETVRHIKKCAVHSAHDHKQVLAENQKKNRDLHAFEQANPGAQYKWSMGADRNIKIERIPPNG